MRQLNGVYTQTHNCNHDCVGHVFQGRFKGLLVQKEPYLLELARYIVLNPVRAQMVHKARNLPWSSCRATAGEVAAPDWLTTEWILSAFGKRKSTAQTKYQEFVAQGKGQPVPWNVLKNQVFLCTEEFITEPQSKLDADKDLSEIPKSQRRAKPLPIAYEKRSMDRNDAIASAYRSGGYSMKELGSTLNYITQELAG